MKYFFGIILFLSLLPLSANSQFSDTRIVNTKQQQINLLRNIVDANKKTSQDIQNLNKNIDELKILVNKQIIQQDQMILLLKQIADNNSQDNFGN